MPEVMIVIGERTFNVACQDGEEHFLLAAARMVDAEAMTLVRQIGRMPEARMLLMSALLLADKMAGLEDQLRQSEARVGLLKAEVEHLRASPVRVEVPVIPPAVLESLGEIAAQAEALADRIEERRVA